MLHDLALDGIKYKNELPDYLFEVDNIKDIDDDDLEIYKPANYLISIVNLYKNYPAHDFWQENEIDNLYDNINISIGKLNNDIIIKVDTDFPISVNLYFEYSKKYIEVLTNILTKQNVEYSIIEEDITEEIAETGYSGGYCYSGDELAFRASLLTRNYHAMQEIAKEFNIKMISTNWTVILHDCEYEDQEMSTRGPGKTYDEAYKKAEELWDDANSDITDESEFNKEVDKYQEELEIPIIPKEIDVSYWSKTNPGKPPVMPSLPYFWIRHEYDASKTLEGQKLNKKILQINDNIKDTFTNYNELDDNLLELAKSKREEIMKLMPELKEIGDKFYETYLYDKKYPKMDDWEEHQKNFINTWWKYVNMSPDIPHPEVFFNESHTYRLTDYIEEYKIWKEATEPLRPLWDEYIHIKELWEAKEKEARDELEYNRNLMNDIQKVHHNHHFINLEEEKEKIQKRIFQKKRFGCPEEFYAVPTKFIFGDQLKDRIKIKFRPIDI